VLTEYEHHRDGQQHCCEGVDQSVQEDGQGFGGGRIAQHQRDQQEVLVLDDLRP
jgi:hypothetical protein